MARTYTLTIDGRPVDAEISEQDGTYTVRIGPNVHVVSLRMIDEGRLFSLLMDGASYEIHSTPSAGVYDLLVRNELFRVEVQRGHRRAAQATRDAEAGGRQVRSPMAGIIAEVLVVTGQAVRRGEVVLVLESMKMKNELRVVEDGVVRHVEVEPGEQVERGQTLLQIDPED
jgi:biotin carboxyl carrier protein